MDIGSQNVQVPGDLGTRVKHRRLELGLSTAEVAERTGMGTRRIERIETRPVALTGGELLRLSRALDTTISGLFAPHRSRSARRAVLTPEPELEPMRRDECIKLIEAGVVGRIAFNRADDLLVIPVNYCYVNELIVFRTAADSTVAQYDLAPIAFEIDAVDESLRDGWSVLVNGTVRPATGQEIEAALGRVEPWAGGTRETYIAIEPRRISGRRIRSW
ncbi:helix-turn-helix domain-containing protein [Kribbella sp. NBC_00889]|uniref:helix-turn-helix domain-containing protein n=1 Tax=Kribbella sp. NBC_00889 TaxID=2975974 RepID=UPI00386697E1|nr:pyridoxamine 5'-phosphate oxidase family protein [Kribbella sp. NBC_00889]